MHDDSKGSSLFTSQRVDRRALVFIVPMPSNRLDQMIVDSKPIPLVPPSTYVAFVTYNPSSRPLSVISFKTHKFFSLFKCFLLSVVG